MYDSSAFSHIWHEIEELEGPPPRVPIPESVCPYAEQFARWCQELCAELQKGATIVTVNQKKVLLLDKYFDWRAVVPKAHRTRMNDRGHRCIWHVFDETYLKVRALELALTPPMLFLPPKHQRPPKPVLPQVAGIVLGEIEDGRHGTK